MAKKKNNKRSAKSASCTLKGKKTKDYSEAINSSVAAVIETFKGNMVKHLPLRSIMHGPN